MTCGMCVWLVTCGCMQREMESGSKGVRGGKTMAWSESHQGLAKHPKTLKVARKLNIHTAQAIGHLHMFWWWALDYAQDGEISNCDPEDIAIAADWPGDASEFFDALVSVGFIDRHEDGKATIHDWYDYAGKLIEKRAADAERKR